MPNVTLEEALNILNNGGNPSDVQELVTLRFMEDAWLGPQEPSNSLILQVYYLFSALYAFGEQEAENYKVMCALNTAWIDLYFYLRRGSYDRFHYNDRGRI